MCHEAQEAWDGDGLMPVWSVEQSGQRCKRMKHGCGYPFYVVASLLYLPTLGMCSARSEVVVHVQYRALRAEGESPSLPLYHCPRCGEELRLWWNAPATGWEMKADVVAVEGRK